LTPGSKTKQKA